MAVFRNRLYGVFFANIGSICFVLFCSFGTFEFLKAKAVDERGNLPAHMRFFCGMGAGVGEAIFAVTPMETIKVR
jgi:hypothetical protein